MRRWLPLFLTVLLFSGCSTLKVTTDYDPDVSFAALRTFAILPADRNGTDTLNEQRIVNALEHVLMAKGYSPTRKTAADFHVRFRTVLRKNVPGNISFGFGFGTFSGGSGASLATSTRSSHDRRVLHVDMTDPASGKTLWRGSAGDIQRRLELPEEREAYINEMVNSLLKTFPVNMRE